MSLVRRLYLERKRDLAQESKMLLEEVRSFLQISSIEDLRILERYDIQGLNDEDYEKLKKDILFKPALNEIYQEDFPQETGYFHFTIEFLPGQFDSQAAKLIEEANLISRSDQTKLRLAKTYLIKGQLSQEEIQRLQSWLINPLDSRLASENKPKSLQMKAERPEDVEIIDGFISMSQEELQAYAQECSFAMNFADLLFTRDYFRDEEKRDPTITELKLIDTYWSDHCRHTTFFTRLEKIEIEESPYKEEMEASYQLYLDARDYVYGQEVQKRDISLMDMAVISMKEMRKRGLLEDLDLSDEINACSIKVKVDTGQKEEDYFLMFKNETHNHPTEIEPFGGASTCLGGAIRDPLSGRSYVYQAMRVSGSADPRKDFASTMPGKLPQRKITREAAKGYSFYGNEIGVAAGQVAEFYDEDFVAKRFELGAVMALVPQENVVRSQPQEGDLVILVGAKTGRDGCGGATSSSMVQTEEDVDSFSTEVQKGDPSTERKIQRLFRNPQASRLIKKCNDFGAGGVSVAIGELADSLEINLDKVPVKYEGMDGTELAISESQERMAAIVDAKDADLFISLAEEENVEARVVAQVTDSGRLIMTWRDKKIVNLKRSFLDTNGVQQEAQVEVKGPKEEASYFKSHLNDQQALEERWLDNLRDLNVASQRGLQEGFDSSAGWGNILQPYTGKRQLTPAEGMARALPILEGESKTAGAMTFGYNPKIGKWSPYHGALYALLESISKMVALGADYRKIRFSLQEYFERLGQDPARWGKPFAALLGANRVLSEFQLAAIGGKDSMSGTYEDIDVPPSLVAFAVAPMEADKLVTADLKEAGSKLVLLKASRNDLDLPDFDQLRKNFTRVKELVDEGKILSATSLKQGGLAAAVSKMAFGNGLGLEFIEEEGEDSLFSPDFASLVLEISGQDQAEQLFAGLEYREFARSISQPLIKVNGLVLDLEESLSVWEEALEDLFPMKLKAQEGESSLIFNDLPSFDQPVKKSKIKLASPRVLIPVFTGMVNEYDLERAFAQAGGQVELLVLKNLKVNQIEESINQLASRLKESQILALPGYLSMAILRDAKIKEALASFLDKNDGLIYGSGSAFNCLLDSGLLPFGQVGDSQPDWPLLVENTIGRFSAKMVRSKIISNKSVWLSSYQPGQIIESAFASERGRFIADEETLNNLLNKGQIAALYVDLEAKETYDISYNPAGSMLALETLISPDGRIVGKMGHNERMTNNKAKEIFFNGISYFSN